VTVNWEFPRQQQLYERACELLAKVDAFIDENDNPDSYRATDLAHLWVRQAEVLLLMAGDD
jgi:hypothetical protein